MRRRRQSSLPLSPKPASKSITQSMKKGGPCGRPLFMRLWLLVTSDASRRMAGVNQSHCLAHSDASDGRHPGCNGRRHDPSRVRDCDPILFRPAPSCPDANLDHGRGVRSRTRALASRDAVASAVGIRLAGLHQCQDRDADHSHASAAHIRAAPVRAFHEGPRHPPWPSCRCPVASTGAVSAFARR